MNVVIKISMAFLLFGCLLSMPYGYFQFIRWACCIGFCWLAYKEWEANKSYIVTACIVGAILFNPIAPIHFVRKTWNIIDVTIAILLVVWVIADLINLKATNKKEPVS